MRGILYSAGRMLAYTAIAALAVAGLLSLPEVSFYLDIYGLTLAEKWVGRITAVIFIGAGSYLTLKNIISLL